MERLSTQAEVTQLTNERTRFKLWQVGSRIRVFGIYEIVLKWPQNRESAEMLCKHEFPLPLWPLLPQ